MSSIILVGLLKRHWLTILVAIFFSCLLFVKSNQNYTLQKNYNNLQKEYTSLVKAEKESQEKSERTLKETTEKLSAQYKQKELKYEKDYNDLLFKYSGVKSQLTSLQQTRSDIQTSLQAPDTSRETYLDYIARYDRVFGECVERYSEVAKSADELKLKNKLLNSNLDIIYTEINNLEQSTN